MLSSRIPGNVAIAVVVAGLLAMPPALAAPAGVHTQDLRIEEGAVRGDIELVQVWGGLNGAALSFVVQAAKADVAIYERTSIGGGGIEAVRVPAGEERHQWTDVVLGRQGDVDRGFAIAIDLDGAGWIAAGDTVFEHADGVFLSERGVHERGNGDTESPPGSDDFRDRARDGHYAIGRAWDQAHNATWRGNAVLEFRGLDLEGTADGEPVRVSSGPEGDGPVRSDVFVRMHLRGAVITMDAPMGAVEQTSWASLGSQAIGRTGQLVVPMPVREGEAMERLLVPAPYSVAITPTKDDLVLEFAPAPSEPSTAVFLPDAVRDPLGIAGIVAFLLIAAVLAAVALRRRRVPGLADVEAALERGDHEAAARHAKRITKDRPDFEGARIGHAIALAKTGRPEAAVRVAEEFLALREPSDGVLYYVMGTALLDLGRRAEARVAFEAAVSRTPQLLEQVGAVAPPRSDAQAYA